MDYTLNLHNSRNNKAITSECLLAYQHGSQGRHGQVDVGAFVVVVVTNSVDVVVDS